MMNDFLRIFLPVYFLIFFGTAFVLKSIQVARKIAKNPVVLPKDDSAYGLIGFYFKLTLIGLFIYLILYGLFPAWYQYFMSFERLEIAELKYAGIALLLISLGWTLIAQNHMRNSWRIGIDMERKTDLVTDGLFTISRNPIFLGMIVSLFGLFLATPNALTAFFLIMGYVLIQLQIRLEEEFLTKAHGQKYLDYKKNVRRLI